MKRIYLSQPMILVAVERKTVAMPLCLVRATTALKTGVAPSVAQEPQ